MSPQIRNSKLLKTTVSSSTYLKILAKGIKGSKKFWNKTKRTIEYYDEDKNMDE